MQITIRVYLGGLAPGQLAYGLLIGGLGVAAGAVELLVYPGSIALLGTGVSGR